MRKRWPFSVPVLLIRTKYSLTPGLLHSQTPICNTEHCSPEALSLLVLDILLPPTLLTCHSPQVKAVRKERPVDLVVGVKGQEVALQVRAKLGIKLTIFTYTFGVKYRLGIAVFRQDGECPAQQCRSCSDKYGDHAISCAIGGERISRHNCLGDTLFQSAQQ